MDLFIVLLFFFFLFVLYMMARNTQQTGDDGYYGGGFGLPRYDDYDQDQPSSGGFGGWGGSVPPRRSSGSFPWLSDQTASSNRYSHSSSMRSNRSTSRRYNSPTITSSSGFGGSSRRTLSKSSSFGRAASRPVKSTPRHSFPKKSSFKK